MVILVSQLYELSQSNVAQLTPPKILPHTFALPIPTHYEFPKRPYV